VRAGAGPSIFGTMDGESAAWVLHVDLDQFLAAVEVRRRPELAGRPVVVGGSGDPGRARQVVATASYEARAFGVRSGMPLRAAARRCPDAVFLPSDAPAYEAASEEVMDTLRSLPVMVEVAGWDEAFLATSADDPERLAAGIQRAVLDRTRLSTAVGIGRNKLQAKLATGFAKPAGVFRLTGDNWEEVMADRPVDALWGVGPRITARLAELGVRHVRDLAATEPVRLAEGFSRREAVWLHRLGHGDLHSPVDPTPREPRGRSHEETFPENLVDREAIDERLGALARSVAAHAAAHGHLVTCVAVKVRFAPYFTKVRQSVVRPPTADPEAVAAVARGLLTRFEPLRPVRLLGVRGEYERNDG
jgi:DNA polymerase-4